MPLLLGTLIKDGEEVVVVRTSDRLNFKRCRRLWGWTSHLRMALQLKEQADYFWFGSGIHFALEDYHGHNVYGHAGKAFLAYVEGHRQTNALPATYEEHINLGLSVLCYYSDYWLKHREPLDTFFVDGIPQCEVNAHIDLGIRDKHGRRIVYGLTLDRIVIDEYGQLWIAEYKTAKMFRVYHYDTDEQVTAYCWGASKIYGKPVAGVLYYQFKKTIPTLPRILANGEVSSASNQQTTAALYRKMLVDMYGDLNIAPQKNIKFLNTLTAEEDEDQDRFIRRERIERNEHQLRNFEARVLLELEDMLNDNLPLYPNQNKDCSWSCPLQYACVAMEDGSDYEAALKAFTQPMYVPKEKELRWRNYLPHPSQVELPAEAQLYQQLVQEVQARSQEEQQRLPGLSPEQAFLEELEG